jgi:PD-(D/E)XK nuclease superfamily protein
MANTRRKPRTLWSLIEPLVRGAMNCKVRGSVAELAFVLKAASLGFGVSKPHADTEHYDFIVDSGKRLSRVQVKSTFRASRCGYQIRALWGKHSPYKLNDIDFLAVYIVPRNIWYIIPVHAMKAADSLAFYPDGCRSDGGFFEVYREAWHLLAG